METPLKIAGLTLLALERDKAQRYVLVFGVFFFPLFFLCWHTQRWGPPAGVLQARQWDALLLTAALFAATGA